MDVGLKAGMSLVVLFSDGGDEPLCRQGTFSTTKDVSFTKYKNIVLLYLSCTGEKL